ncbi:hypothetical protein [Corallococcus sp. CA041A]|nr:hypothetical protein [Corallococcus sp. CA041A]
MGQVELFIFGTRIVAAAELAEQPELRTAMAACGGKAMDKSLTSLRE